MIRKNHIVRGMITVRFTICLLLHNKTWGAFLLKVILLIFNSVWEKRQAKQIKSDITSKQHQI